MKTHILFVGLIVGQLVCFAQNKPDQNERGIWGRSFMREPMPDGKDARLECDGVSQGREHLIGEFVLTRQRDGTPLAIQGRFNKMGEFIPNVLLEVSDRDDGNWKSIESSLSDKVDVTLTAAPHIEHLFTRIQLDAFQSYIGKFRFCRVALQTGESDVFPMAWLTEKGE